MLSGAMVSMSRLLEKLGPALYSPDRVEGGSAKLNFRFTEFYEVRIAPVQTVRGRRGGEKAPQSIILLLTTRAKSFQTVGGAVTFSERKTSKNRVDSTLPPASWAPNVLYQWACSSVACIASSLSHRVTVSILPFSVSPNSQSPR